MSEEKWQKIYTARYELAEICLEEKNVSAKPFTRRGTTDYYRCKNKKKYACEFKLRVLKFENDDPSTDATEMWTVETNGEHAHSEESARTQGPPGLHSEIRQVIKTTSEFGSCTNVRKRKINEVLDSISQENSPKVQRQITNHIQYENRKQMKRSISVGELEAFCQAHREPTGKHKAFIPSFSSDTRSNKLFVPITTPHMLENAQQGPILAVDATYSVNTDDYPLIIAGCLDSNGKFHHVALAIIQSDEKEEAYADFFSFLRQQLPAWAPEAVMADGSQAISNAIKKVFPDASRLMCHFHSSQKVEDHARSKIGAGWEKVKQQYLDLQLADSPQVFHRASELFLCDLIEEGHAEFAEYFTKWWLTNMPNWYEGAYLGYPSTNNANESANGKFKSNSRKMPMGSFLQELVKRTQDASRNSAMHRFAKSPELTLSVQTEGFQYLHKVNVNEAITKEYENVGCDGKTVIKTVYYVKSGSNSSMSLSDYKRIRKSPDLLKSFDDYNTWRKSFYMVEKVRSLNAHTCTCYQGLKVKVCKHIVAVRLLFEPSFDVRSQAKDVPLGETRKAGRPKGT